jgi:hypothetical protein
MPSIALFKRNSERAVHDLGIALASVEMAVNSGEGLPKVAYFKARLEDIQGDIVELQNIVRGDMDSATGEVIKDARHAG